MSAHAFLSGVELGPEPWTWTLDPLQLLPLALAAWLYARRSRTLAGRGRPVGIGYRLAFYSGLGLLLVAFVSPVDSIGEERLLAVHMVQHILIGDLAALLVVFGLTGPLLRPILALPAVGRLRGLAHPLVAFPLWAVNLYLWHLRPAYEAALAHDSVHAVQHACFFTAGAFMWAALIEPLPGPAWFGTGFKALAVAGLRVAQAVLANVFVWSGRPFYPHYEHAERLWGISPISDQNIGGAVMLLEGMLLTLGVFAWLVLRWLSEGERTQLLVEQGVDPLVAQRVVRYGRREALVESPRPAEPA